MYSKAAHYFAREGRYKNASAKVSAQIQDAEYFEHPVDKFNIFSCIFHRFEGRSLELLALKLLMWRIIRVYTKSEDYLEYSLGIRMVVTARNEHAIGNKMKLDKWGQGCHTGVSCIWECEKSTVSLISERVAIWLEEINFLNEKKTFFKFLLFYCAFLQHWNSYHQQMHPFITHIKC